MVKSATAETPAAPASTAGFIGRIFSKAFAGMTAEERKTTLADALLSAGAAVKSDIMEGKEPDIEMVEDLWVDGPESMPPSKRVSGGVTGNHAGGTIVVGPSQLASGMGAAKQSEEYSRPAAQHGAQLSTEKLGKLLSSMGESIKSLSNQMALMTTAMSVLIDENGAVKSQVAKLALRKSEKEDGGPESEEEEAEDEAKENESGSGTEVEITNEIDEDDDAESDEDKAKALSSAKHRALAKMRLRLARGRAVKAVEAEADGNAKAARRHRKVAKCHVDRAQALFARAKSIRPEASTKLAALEKSLRSTAKALQAESHNQDKWPDTGDQPVGNGPAAKTTAIPPNVTAPSADMTNLMKTLEAQVQETHKGLAMFQTTVKGMYELIAAGQGRGGPPTIAKSTVAVAAPTEVVPLSGLKDIVEQKYSDGEITRVVADSAVEILAQKQAAARGFQIPVEIINAREERLPEPLRSIFKAAA